LATAKGDGIGRYLIAQKGASVQLPICGTVTMELGELREVDAHHAGAHRACPAFGSRFCRMDTGVPNRLLRRDERELVRARGELQELSVVDHVFAGKAFHLGSDSHGETARVE
jgi:hypothetical protein